MGDKGDTRFSDTFGWQGGRQVEAMDLVCLNYTHDTCDLWQQHLEGGGEGRCEGLSVYVIVFVLVCLSMCMFIYVSMETWNTTICGQFRLCG